MSCAKVREHLPAFVDAMLAPAERAEVERHVAGCPDCAAEAQRLRALDELLGASPALEPSPRFESSFLARLRAEPELAPAAVRQRAAIYRAREVSLWQRLFGGWRGFAFAGAAAAVAIAVAVWPAREA